MSRTVLRRRREKRRKRLKIITFFCVFAVLVLSVVLIITDGHRPSGNTNSSLTDNTILEPNDNSTQNADDVITWKKRLYCFRRQDRKYDRRR